MAGRNLKRCEAHGLAYDPAIQAGCTLCRNSQQPKPTLATMEVSGKDVAMVIIMALWVVAVLSGGYFGIQRLQASVSERVAKARAGRALPVSTAAVGAHRWVALECSKRPRSEIEKRLRRKQRCPRRVIDFVGIAHKVPS
jgi:hypothetical protein